MKKRGVKIVIYLMIAGAIIVGQKKYADHRINSKVGVLIDKMYDFTFTDLEFNYEIHRECDEIKKEFKGKDIRQLVHERVERKGDIYKMAYGNVVDPEYGSYEVRSQVVGIISDLDDLMEEHMLEHNIDTITGKEFLDGQK